MNATVEYTEDKTSKMAEIITRYKQYPPEAIMFQAAKEIAELQAENASLKKGYCALLGDDGNCTHEAVFEYDLWNMEDDEVDDE